MIYIYTHINIHTMYIYIHVCVFIYIQYMYILHILCDPPTVSSIHKTRMSPTQGLRFGVLGFSGVGSSGIRGIINVNDH